MLEIGTPEFEEYCNKIAQIHRLEESITPRLLREAAIGIEFSVGKLAEINDQIDAIRATL